MLNFFLGVFLVACRSEWSILKPLKGGNARQFFLAACRSKFFDFLPLKEGEMLVNFVLGVFLVACRSEWSILKPLKGENSCQFFVGCLPAAILRFLTLKTRGNACQFFCGCFFAPFRFQMDHSGFKWTIPAPKSIELRRRKCPFCLVLLSAFRRLAVLRTWRVRLSGW